MAIKKGTKVDTSERTIIRLEIWDPDKNDWKLMEESDADNEQRADWIRGLALAFDRGGDVTTKFRLIERTAKTRIQYTEKVVAGEGAEDEGHRTGDPAK